jgi:hypothetical protein
MNGTQVGRWYIDPEIGRLAMYMTLYYYGPSGCEVETVDTQLIAKVSNFKQHLFPILTKLPEEV